MKHLIVLILAVAFILTQIVSAATNGKIRPGVILYKLNDNISSSELKSLNVLKKSHVLSEEVVPGLNLHIAKLNSKGKELAVSKLFSNSGLVKFAEPDMEFTPSIVPNDQYFSIQWHHTTIGSQGAWDILTGPINLYSARVCVLDTGVDIDHPDLVDNLLVGYNANGLSTVEDVHGHGSGTAGVIGAVGNNSIGAAGVLWNINIIPVQINISNQNSSAYISTMAIGIRWCADQGVKVVNLSYGGANSSSIDAAATYLRNTSSGLLFMSSGNAGNNNSIEAYPDWDSFVIVGATNEIDERADFSDYGPFVDITAPGESIVTTYKNGGYVYYDGTSFSSPMTAGLGAMIYSMNPNFTSSEVEDFIFNTANNLGIRSNTNEYGHGRIDVLEAITQVYDYLDVPNNDLPSAFFNVNASSSNIYEFEFDSEGSVYDAGKPNSFIWDFGDGMNAHGKVVSHTYGSLGEYSVVLTVIDSMGAIDVSDPFIVNITDTNLVVAPSGLIANVNTNNITLDWLDNSDNEDGFIIQRAKKRRGKFNFDDLESIISSDIETFVDIVSKIGDYKYRVYAYKGSITSDYSNEVLVKVDIIGTTPPEPEPDPGLNDPVLSYVLEGNKVTLNWSSCSEDTNIICKYIVEKGTRKVKGQIEDFVIITPNDYLETFFLDESLSNGTYYYRVKELNTNYSNTVSVRVK